MSANGIYWLPSIYLSVYWLLNGSSSTSSITLDYHWNWNDRVLVYINLSSWKRGSTLPFNNEFFAPVNLFYSTTKMNKETGTGMKRGCHFLTIWIRLITSCLFVFTVTKQRKGKTKYFLTFRLFICAKPLPFYSHFLFLYFLWGGGGGVLLGYYKERLTSIGTRFPPK